MARGKQSANYRKAAQTKGRNDGSRLRSEAPKPAKTMRAIRKCMRNLNEECDGKNGLMDQLSDALPERPTNDERRTRKTSKSRS